MQDLDTRLGEVEALGALVAAAHLQTAIDALAREFGIAQESSNTD